MNNAHQFISTILWKLSHKDFCIRGQDVNVGLIGLKMFMLSIQTARNVCDWACGNKACGYKLHHVT